jgi:hypothetical protein
VASADIVLLDGLAVIHNTGDPGVGTNVAGGSDLRIGLLQDCGNQGNNCVRAYGDINGIPVQGIVNGGTANCWPTSDSSCLFLDFYAAPNGPGTPLHDQVFLTVSPSSGELVAQFCLQYPTCPIDAAGVLWWIDPGTVAVCVLNAPTLLCDGVLYSLSPLCVKRLSDEFVIVCET